MEGEEKDAVPDTNTDWFAGDKLGNVKMNRLNNLVAIDFPGIVKNTDRALSMLGGCEGISKTYSQSNKRVSVKWRPEDPFCKPAYGERCNTTNLLMKVKRRWRKGDNSQQSSQYSVEVIGAVGTTYKFQAMSDYQYLPMTKQTDSTYEGFLQDLVVDRLSDRREFLNKDTPLFLPPSIFSRTDYPDRDYLYRSPIQHREGYVDPDTKRPDHIIGKVRQKRTNFTMFLGYNDDIPEKPGDEAASVLRSRYNVTSDEQTLNKLFNVRPIWSKTALRYHFQDTKDRLKILLPLVAYYYLNGPWRCMWVKFGYDPRKNPEARLYQTIDFRKRQDTVGDSTGIKLKRGENLLSFPSMRRNLNNEIKIDVKSMQASDKEGAKNLSSEEKSFVYTEDTIPPCRQMFYQLCDLRAPKLQEIVNSSYKEGFICSEKDGWFPRGTIEKCRDLMTFYTMKLLNQNEEITIEDILKKRCHHKKKRQRLERISEVVNKQSSSSSSSSSEEEQFEGTEEDVNEMETEMLDFV